MKNLRRSRKNLRRRRRKRKIKRKKRRRFCSLTWRSMRE